MKNSKRIAVFFAVLFCLTAVLFAFTACNDKGNDLEKTITIVIGEGENQTVFADYTTTARYLVDVLTELSNKETDPLSIEGSWSSYGLFLTKIGKIAADTPSSYIAVLTSDTQYIDSTDFAVKKTYNGKEVVSANLGVSSLPLSDGQIYMFVVMTF